VTRATKLGAPVGALGAHQIVAVDARGAVQVVAARCEIDWLVGTGDRWRRAASEPGVRQHRISGAPAVQTRLAVPGGDIVHEVYAVAGSVPLAIIDVHNDSPEAVALAIVVRGEPGHGVRAMRGDGRAVFVDESPLLYATRPAQHVATASDEASLLDIVTANATTAGCDFDVRDRNGGVVAAVVWAVAHRTHLRISVPLARTTDPVDATVVNGAPDVHAVVRGWQLHLERGMRVEHDDVALVELADAARGALVLLADADEPRPGSDEAAACEDWGFDAEALTAWSRLGWRARRAAGRRDRAAHRDAWQRLRNHLNEAGTGPARHPACFLRALRDVVLSDTQTDGESAVELLNGFPLEWLGQNLAVHDAPTRHGPVSFALRWHGARPALLWSAPPGVVLRAPRFDAAWRTVGGDGEVLFDPPSGELMSFETGAPAASTEPGDAGTFI
jgi:hypothetical protein